MPNFPSALRKSPPKEKGQTTEDTILETLPDVSTTVNGMAVLRLLSKDSADHVSLYIIRAHIKRLQFCENIRVWHDISLDVNFLLTLLSFLWFALPDCYITKDI